MCFVADLTQCGEKAAFKPSADEALSEAEAWSSFSLNAEQNEIQTLHLETLLSPAWLREGGEWLLWALLGGAAFPSPSRAKVSLRANPLSRCLRETKRV